jgi:hypothetical protein
MEKDPVQGFLPLGVGELEVEHAAVAFDQGQAVELPVSVPVWERAKVAPIDLDLLVGRRLIANEGPSRFLCGAHGAQVVLEDGIAAVESQGSESLPHDFGADLGIDGEQTRIPPEQVQLAGSW